MDTLARKRKEFWNSFTKREPETSNGQWVGKHKSLLILQGVLAFVNVAL
jgi:hypothetical protein